MPPVRGLKQQIVNRGVGLPIDNGYHVPGNTPASGDSSFAPWHDTLESVLAEGHLLLRTGLGINHPEVAVARGFQLFRGKNLDGPPPSRD